MAQMRHYGRMLRLGALEESVTVEGAAPLVDVQSSAPAILAFEENSMRNPFDARVVLLLLSTIHGAAAQTPAPDIRPLNFGVAVERNLDGGQGHKYQIVSSGNQYLHLIVDQKGIDVVVLLSVGDGQRMLEMDSPNGTQGFESVETVLEAAGTYIVEVRALQGDAPAGAYAIRIQEMRQATPADRLALAATPGTPLGQLRINVEQITRSVNAQWGVYIKCIETGEEITLNADAVMDTMSVIKIPLMAEVLRQAESGRLSLDERVSLADIDKRSGTGILQSLASGASLTVRDLVTLMIIVSDNTATDILFKKVGGPQVVTALMRQYGLNTIIASRTTGDWFEKFLSAPDVWVQHIAGDNPLGLSSPRDMGRLLERIYQGEAVSGSASRQMLQIMRSQVYGSRLPRYIGPAVTAHKTGDFLPYIGNDVGIIETPSRHVVICVFTAHHNGSSALLEDAIGRIAEQVLNFYTFH